MISTELEETQSLLVDEQKLRASAENALSASLTREQELVRTLTKVKTERASLTTNLSEAERRISNLQAEKRQGEEELAQSNENLMKTQNHVEQLEALIVDLREETVNRRLAFEELAEEKKRFDEENAQTISDLRSQNQTLVSILKLNQKKFDSQAAKSRAMIKCAEKDRDVYQEEGVQLRGEIQVLNEAIEGLEEQLSLSEDKLVISRNKLEREKTHSAALTDQISFLEDEQKRIQNRLLTALTSLQNSLKVSESLMHLLPESVGEEESNSTSVADFCEKYEGLFSLEQLSNLGC